jgi:hypothetical protein
MLSATSANVLAVAIQVTLALCLQLLLPVLAAKMVFI